MHLEKAEKDNSGRATAWAHKWMYIGTCPHALPGCFAFCTRSQYYYGYVLSCDELLTKYWYIVYAVEVKCILTVVFTGATPDGVQVTLSSSPVQQVEKHMQSLLVLNKQIWLVPVSFIPAWPHVQVFVCAGQQSSLGVYKKIMSIHYIPEQLWSCSKTMHGNWEQG